MAIPLAVFIHTRFKGLRNGVVGAYFLPCRPNVMASDLGLPQMDGLALVRASRADAALNGMRCIALSGDAPAESRGRALQAGFDDDWTKPLALELLASEVRQATRNAAARQKGDPPAWASTV